MAKTDLIVDFSERTACDGEEATEFTRGEAAKALGDIVGTRPRRFADLIAESDVSSDVSCCSYRKYPILKFRTQLPTDQFVITFG